MCVLYVCMYCAYGEWGMLWVACIGVQCVWRDVVCGMYMVCVCGVCVVCSVCVWCMCLGMCGLCVCIVCCVCVC